MSDFDPFRYRISSPLELDQEQQGVLVSILDTFFPCLPQDQEDTLVNALSKTHTEQQVRKFSRLSCSNLGTLQTVIDMINRTVLPEKRLEFSTLLSTLSTRPGMFLMTGYFNLFDDLTLAQREKIILSWRDSYMPQLRALYMTFRGLACVPVFLTHLNDFEDSIHYDLKADQVFENLPQRLPMLQSSEIHDDMHFDIIVIGSGAGGGVIASQLAKSGKSVLVIEKGKYYHENDFVHGGGNGLMNLYEYGGYSNISNGSMSIIAGSVFGGGTTVNWSASLKPQHFVREEWANQGLSHFLSPKFSKDLDTVYERIGATTEGIKHNGSNQVLMDGCKILGYPQSEVPQNTSGKSHVCHFCFSGCRAGIKNGTMNTWLRDAHKCGAQFLDKTKVKKVLIENNIAVGVACLVHYERTVHIKADRIIVSCGSLQSPGVLLRSGLKNNHIGRNLRLHPCLTIVGHFNQPLRSFEGPLITVLSNVAENTENDGYGCKLEGISTQPHVYASVLPWRGAEEYKKYMMQLEHAASILVVTRDKESLGSVQYDQDENVSIHYTLSSRDRRSMVEGMLRAADVIVAAGGREVQTPQIGVDPFRFNQDEESSIDNQRYLDWKTNVNKYGVPDDAVIMTSPHQMGSCRMGISPKTSVVKPTGETWEVKNLFVADASVFPTASGVNPMVTIEAIAMHIADSIKNEAKANL